VAGLGDKLRGDDGLGCFIIEELKKIKLPRNIEVEDFGCDIFSLIDRLWRYEKIIFVDAIKKGGNPGDIYKLELNEIENKKLLNLHELKIDKIILLLRATGLKSKIIFIGCEPKNFNFRIGLSKEIKRIFPKIIKLILEEIQLE